MANPGSDVSATAHPRRLMGLDFIRGIAILLVLCRHLHLTAPTHESNQLHAVFYWLQGGGWCGVDLFFVLSGFLVSNILFRQFQSESRVDIGRFLIRRGFKIYPPFWVMLEATVIYYVLKGGKVPAGPLWVEICFVQNYLPGLYGHTWSLAVEEHCYLGLAILFVICVWCGRESKNPFWLLPWLAILGVIVATAMRNDLSSQLLTLGPRSILFPTHLRFDGFLAGTALAHVSTFQPRQFQRLTQFGPFTWTVLGGLLLAPVFFFDLRRDPIVVNCLLTTNILVGCCWILAAHASQGISTNHGKPTTGIRRLLQCGVKLVALIGMHSYSIYLWHDLLEHAVLRRILGIANTAPVPEIHIWIPLYFATTIGGGIALSYAIEQPALRWRDRLVPREPTNHPVR